MREPQPDRPDTNVGPDSPDGSPEEMNRREQEWKARKDVSALWPGLRMSLLQPAADDIGRAVACVLRGERGTLGAHADHDRRALGVAALLSGTGPLLGYWLERGRLDVPGDVATLLAEHLWHGRRRAERIASGMQPVLRGFAAAGVSPVALKGFHTARAYFPEPGTRPYGDVDLLVRPEEIPRAIEVLSDLRFAPDDDLWIPYKRNWSPPDDPDSRNASFERWDARTRWKLELHSGVQFNSLYESGLALPLDWGMTGEVGDNDAPLRALAQPLLLAALAIHASGELYSMRLLRLIEQVFVIRSDLEAGRLEWLALEELLVRTRTVRLVYPSLALVEQLVPGTVDERLLARARKASTRRVLEIMAGLTPSAPIFASHLSIKERLMWSDSPMRTARRLLALVMPAPNHSWSMQLRIYHQRFTRLLAGKVTLGAPPALRDDDDEQ